MKPIFLAKVALATLAAGCVAASLAASIPRGAAHDGPSKASPLFAEESPKAAAVKEGRLPLAADDRRQLDSERNAIRQLRGTWEVVQTYANDAEIPFRFDHYRWRFSDDGTVRSEWKTPGEVVREAENGIRLRFSINPTSVPPQLTVFGDGILMQFVYQLDNNDLKLGFYGRSEAERPQGFTARTTRNNGSTLIVWLLKRREERP